jgi:hypothetical protein
VIQSSQAFQTILECPTTARWNDGHKNMLQTLG